MPKVLVTGATGFIGSHLADRLKADGFDVRIVARRTSNLDYIGRLGVEVVEGDVRDAESLRLAVRGVGTVFHAAALVGEWGRAKDFYDINVRGTRNLLEAMKAEGVRRLIDVSTCAVHGYEGKDNTGETAPFVKTGVLYSDTKADAEKIVWEYHRRGDVEATAIRPVMVWGPRDPAYLPKLIRLMRSGVFIYIGDGNNIAGLSHARNVAHLIMLAYERKESVGEAFLVTDGCKTTYRDIVPALAEKLGLKVKTFGIPYPMAKILGSASESALRLLGAKKAPLMTRMGSYILGNSLSYSIEKARRVLGYEPQVTFAEGIDEYVESFQKQIAKR
ncbi:MAG: NAD-dependent epimerase/dehydratase family protein [bacterium]